MDYPWDEKDEDHEPTYALVGHLIIEYGKAEAYAHLLACQFLNWSSPGFVDSYGLTDSS